MNKYYYLKYIKDSFFRLINIKYTFSLKFKKVKVEYFIGIYNGKKDLISPSEFMLFDNIRLFCHIEINLNNTKIESLANIYNNKYFTCTEFFNIYDKINFGIVIYKKKKKEEKIYYNVTLFKNNILHYNNLLNKNDNIFDSLYNNNEYLNNTEYHNKTKLISLYKRYPHIVLKRNFFDAQLSGWIYRNIYNSYFCFCKEMIV